MSNIEITLPDGSKQSVAAETRPIDIARGISPRLADAAIAAKVNGEMFDLTRPIEQDATLQILTAKDPESLEVYRHSTAHLLAAAVLELYPETQLGIALWARPTTKSTMAKSPDPTNQQISGNR